MGRRHTSGESLIRIRLNHMGPPVKFNRSQSFLCLALVAACLASGCIFGYDTSSPADTVNSYLDGLQGLDLQGLNGLVIPPQRLDDAALKGLRDNVSAATQKLAEWQISFANRTLAVQQQNETAATVNVSADVLVSVKVRGVRQVNQTHLDAAFELELVDSQWLVANYYGPQLLPTP